MKILNALFERLHDKLLANYIYFDASLQFSLPANSLHNWNDSAVFIQFRKSRTIFSCSFKSCHHSNSYSFYFYQISGLSVFCHVPRKRNNVFCCAQLRHVSDLGGDLEKFRRRNGFVQKSAIIYVAEVTYRTFFRCVIRKHILLFY